jgi:SecD/SecF fusion protein
MNTSIKLKLVLIFFLIIGSITTIVPSFYEGTPDWWKKYMAPKGLTKGLDLQGGIHLVLKVNLKIAAKNNLDFAANDLVARLADESISAVKSPSSTEQTLVYTLPNTNAAAKVNELLKEDESINVKVEANEGSFPRIFLSLSEKKIDYIKNNAVNQSLEIIRNRIDEFGVAEPVIIRQGEDEIVVQLPGIDDPQRAIDLIGKTAQLQFKIVYDAPGVNLQELIDKATSSGQWDSKEGKTDELNKILAGQLPPGTSIYFQKEKDPQTTKESKIPILLEDKVLMTGDMIKNAQVRIGGSFNMPLVSLDMTSRGARVFGEVTGANVNRRMAIVLDDVVRSAPNINEKILGGSAQITGRFTHEEASDLAIVLRVGALPAPVEIIQNMTVGATLGQDSIDKGLYSGFFGAILVLAFMLIYYRLPGAIANVALILNILFLFTGLAIINATLTLPGIAGIVLSIGMAVDANVLIFERMREEYAIGKTVKSSIDGGFGKAFWTIVDSQVTTLITAMALFMFGTGPIKGFAITLSFGIIFNLFTALFCSRLMFDGLTARTILTKFSFMQFSKTPNLDFMGLKKITFTISGILVSLGVLAFILITLGKANLGVDFSGGSLLQYKAEQSFSMDEVRTALETSKIDGLNLQEVKSENRLIIKVKKSEEKVANLDKDVSAILKTELADKGFVLESTSEIGSSVSAILRNKAIQAILISLAGVIIYLAFRFDLSFGVAAAVATFHDVLVVLGLCWILKIEITLLIVTALLTLAGYSLNDSVVIFDRIRENMRKSEFKPLPEIINLSINQVISRTIVTSLTSAMVLLALVLFGGSVIHDFSFALLAGVVIGTYSSIFIASPILTLWKKA